MTGARHIADEQGAPSDLAVGTRRARAALLLMLALPGSAYIYQGDELGLPDVEDIPDDRLQDPIWTRSGHTVRGRDGCRVPMPWSGERPPFGFTEADAARTWLPQPLGWRDRTVEAQLNQPGSMLNLYRAALGLRREHRGFATGMMRWRGPTGPVLDLERGGGLRCVVNLGPAGVPLGAGETVLLASAEFTGRDLPPDTAVWLEG